MNVRGARDGRLAGFPTGGIAVLGAAVVALTAAVTISSPLPGEIALMREVQSWPIATLAHLGILAGESWVDAVVAAAAAMALLVILRRRDLAAFVVVCALLRTLSTVLKIVVGRARPDATQARIDEVQTTFAFPSGHTLGATLCWGSLAVVAWLLLRGRPRYLATAGLLLVPLATGIGRVYVGAHWPTDVVGGWLIGAIPLVAMAASAGTRGGQNGPMDRLGAKSDGSHNRGWQN